MPGPLDGVRVVEVANWTFVPGYANGKDPYGSYTARQFYVASQWSSQGTFTVQAAAPLAAPQTDPAIEPIVSTSPPISAMNWCISSNGRSRI